MEKTNDINKLTQEEEHLILSKFRSKAFESYFIYDVLDKRLKYINQAFENLWGKSRYEFFSMLTLIKAIHKEDRAHVLKNIDELINKREFRGFQFRIDLRKGKTRWVQAKLYPILEDEKVKWIAGYLEEITRNKMFEEVLYNINFRKNSLLEVLGHDLTRPINTIQLLSSMLKKTLNVEEYSEIRKYLQIIDDTCNSCINLITNLVNDELLETINVELIRERVDIVEKLNLLIDIYKTSEVHSHKNFIFESSEPKIFVEIDEVKFLQSVNNLISNALKFTRPKGTIITRVEKIKNTLKISVIDDGIGIPSILQPYVFDKFTPAGRKGIKGERTIGIGMFTSKSFIELHGGKIWFESIENKGTSFFIEVPSEN